MMTINAPPTIGEYMALLRHAEWSEQKAAEYARMAAVGLAQIDIPNMGTRSICRYAAELALHCHELDQAEEMLKLGLSLNPTIHEISVFCRLFANVDYQRRFVATCEPTNGSRR